VCSTNILHGICRVTKAGCSHNDIDNAVSSTGELALLPNSFRNSLQGPHPRLFRDTRSVPQLGTFMQGCVSSEIVDWRTCLVTVLLYPLSKSSLYLTLLGYTNIPDVVKYMPKTNTHWQNAPSHLTGLSPPFHRFPAFLDLRSMSQRGNSARAGSSSSVYHRPSAASIPGLVSIAGLDERDLCVMATGAAAFVVSLKLGQALSLSLSSSDSEFRSISLTSHPPLTAAAFALLKASSALMSFLVILEIFATHCRSSSSGGMP
jgi:hypothetical protein